MKNFPTRFCSETTLSTNGFSWYVRPRIDPITLRNKSEEDNSLVVPPNRKHSLTEGLALLDGLRSFSQLLEQMKESLIKFAFARKVEVYSDSHSGTLWIKCFITPKVHREVRGSHISPDLPRRRSRRVGAVTRFVICETASSLYAETTGSILVRIFATFGIPITIHSDRGSSFTSDCQFHLCKLLKIDERFSPVNFPRFNGFAERNVGTIKSMLIGQNTTR